MATISRSSGVPAMNKPLKSRLLDSAVERPHAELPVTIMDPPAALPPVTAGPGVTDLSAVPAIAPPAQPTRIMICIPSGRTWEARTATAVAGLVGFSVQQGLSIGIINLEGSMITKQRNDLVESARKHGADYILFIDSDLTFPPDTLVRLLAHKKDVVGATYNKRVPPYETLGRLKGPPPSDEELRKGGLRQAELLPGGMVLVKMSVYDKLTWPWYHESYQWDGANGVEQLKEYLRNNYCAFAPEAALAELDSCEKLSTWLNEVFKIESQVRWAFYSEDLAFFRKLAKAGIECWCDMAVTFSLVHLGVLEVSCRMPEKPSTSVLVPAVM
jgi:hypothetical protein